MQTLSQRRASKALELLEKITEKKDERNEFSQFCKSFPTMILQNGLGQAIAFLKSQKDKNDKPDYKYATMYNTLNAWLKELNLIKEDTLREINYMDAQEYLHIQMESLKFLEWIKRYENAGIFK